MADWTEFAVSGVSEDTPKNIMLGAGTLYKNFEYSTESSKWTGTILGATYTAVYGASFTNPSSRLVKENVVDMSEEEAKKILQLKPVDFDYIEAYGGEKNQHGLIAEDTLDIIPSCVTIPEGYSEKEFDAEKGIRNKVLAIDYSKLVPYLIKMVQIQQEEIEKLKEAMNKEGVSND